MVKAVVRPARCPGDRDWTSCSLRKRHERAGSVKGHYYIVESGLTRRLIEADNAEDARTEFLMDHPARRIAAGLDEVIRIREAEDQEVLEFARRRRATFDGQIGFELNDARKEAPRRQTKEVHA